MNQTVVLFLSDITLNLYPSGSLILYPHIYSGLTQSIIQSISKVPVTCFSRNTYVTLNHSVSWRTNGETISVIAKQYYPQKTADSGSQPCFELNVLGGSVKPQEL